MPLKLLQLWMMPTWTAASTVEDLSGASVTAKNAVEVLNLSLQHLFLQHPRKSAKLGVSCDSCPQWIWSSCPELDDQP
jgi:hypothetical protein